MALAALIAEHTGRPIKTGHIFYWREKSAVPTDCCVAIEAITAQEVRREHLRPDDYWRHWPDLPAPEAATTGEGA